MKDNNHPDKVQQTKSSQVPGGPGKTSGEEGSLEASGSQTSRPEAIRLLKALSDKSRLEVLDRLKVGPSYVEELSAALGLAPSTVSFHLRKLEEVQLVSGTKEQYYTVYRLTGDILDRPLGELLGISGEADLVRAREDAYRQTILDHFMEGGRLKSIPVQRKKKRVILEELGRQFTPGVRYPEKAVNLIIADFHDDFCTLRRELIMEKILNRENGVYWKPDDVTEKAEPGTDGK